MYERVHIALQGGEIPSKAVKKANAPNEAVNHSAPPTIGCMMMFNQYMVYLVDITRFADHPIKILSGVQP